MSRFTSFTRTITLALLLLALLGSTPVLATNQPDDEETGPAYTFVTKEPVAHNLAAVHAAIRYPSILSEMRVEGNVYMRVLVGTDGKPVRIEFADHAHPLFHEAVRKAAKQLQFSPGQLEGQAVNTWVTIPFRFRLL